MMHKVMCSVCGKEDRIEVFHSKKIKNKNWNYFGRSTINSNKCDKYYYRLLMDNKGNFVMGKDGVKTKKIKNPEYVPDTKPKRIESWDCKQCWGKA